MTKNNNCLKNLSQTLIDLDGGECGFINIWRLGKSSSKRHCTVGEWLSKPENQSGTWLIDPKWSTAIGPISVVWNDVNKNWELFSIKLNEHLYLRS